ncbi:hypothetical protein H9L39_07902 [Fusarium oxysporum f. sp. albedinis]|nr:hypothetical protein H9L39_07902 [Fusarium oxysporum f. sp. albedinis]
MDLWGSDNPLCEQDDVGCLQSVVDWYGEVEETRWYCVLKLDRLPRLVGGERFRFSTASGRAESACGRDSAGTTSIYP